MVVGSFVMLLAAFFTEFMVTEIQTEKDEENHKIFFFFFFFSTVEEKIMKECGILTKKFYSSVLVVANEA